MSEAKWYILHTYSGYENKVANDIKTLAENRNLQNLIEDVMVPIGPATDDYGKPVLDKDGNQKEEKLFPCYVYVKMVMTDESWHVVRNVRGVTGFVGPGSKPVPLTDAEVAAIIADEGQVVSVSAFNIGDEVDIVDGVMAGFSGILSEISPEGSEVTVTVPMAGRDMPVKLDMKNIRKKAAQ